MQTVVSVLDHAYRCLCSNVEPTHPMPMCGTCAFIGTLVRIRLEADLHAGRFRFGPLIVVTKADGGRA
jgi:hypothetical protein